MHVIDPVIRAYYHNEFPRDLRRFIPQLDLPYFGHSWQSDCGGLVKIAPEHRAKFLVCLYFTVLMDQGVYSHFQALYASFERLTRYPKFCHGLGQFQKNPRQILDSPVTLGLVSQDAVSQLIPAGMELFVSEVIDFCQRHFPELQPEVFFDKLVHDPDVQIPLLLVMSDPTLKETPVWKAYESLRATVVEKWPDIETNFGK